MQEQKTMLKIFTEEDIESFKPEMKIGLLATVNEEGLPHLTLISTLQASTPTELFWGQFAEGMSKHNIKRDPKTGFLIMTLDKNLWRGKARYTRTSREGREYDILNNTPLFRYNSYFGIHTVYYMDLVEQQEKAALPMGSIVQAFVFAFKHISLVSIEERAQHTLNDISPVFRHHQFRHNPVLSCSGLIYIM
jgi:hypothetical protein